MGLHGIRNHQLKTVSKEITIRRGGESDLVDVLGLIHELAAFVGHSAEVENTVERMKLDGFGPNPIYGFFVAEKNGKVVGASIYYYRFSTWKGKRLYLEDFIVQKDERGKGIGKLLFEATMKKSIEENCSGMQWQVVKSNHHAIEFYKKYNAAIDTEFINCSMEADSMIKIMGDA